jgi:hypothetical protein
MSADATTVRAAVQMIPARPAATTWRVCPPDLELPAGALGTFGPIRHAPPFLTTQTRRRRVGRKFAKEVWRRHGTPRRGCRI